MMKFFTSTIAVFPVLFTTTLLAQPSVHKVREITDKAAPGLVASFKTSTAMKDQASLLFGRNANIPVTAVREWLGTALHLRPNTDALEITGKPVQFGSYEVHKLQQMYKGIKVEHGIINATGKNGKTQMLQFEFYPIEDNFKTTPNITEADALSRALNYTGATVYAWQASPQMHQLPKGELVIMADFYNNGKMTLAYKFEIYAVQPLSRAYMYINANDGKLLLQDNIIKHLNVLGPAQTRFSGRQNIIADFNAAAPVGQQFRLRQTRDGHQIWTLNHRNTDESPANTAAAVDFTDNDNVWDSTEYGPKAKPVPNLDDAALEAHFNMTLVNDYWKDMHGRNSWDGNGANIISFIHVTSGGNFMNNAYWNGRAMFFGDGDGAADPPQVSIDDCGHELGHAICQTTSGLVYRWESGALNEGFSDIWAACITNYLLKKDSAIPGNKQVWRLFEETSNLAQPQKGLRDMADPTIFGDPANYKDPNWQPASYDVCPKPKGNNPGNNDNCGVHTNSGVLNKWFYILTHGDTSANFLGNNYSIAGIGFGKSDSIAYLTELNLTPNSGYKTASMVSANAAVTLFGDNAEAKAVRDAWIAVAVDTAVYNMANTPVFLTNSFSQVVVGKHGCIWAGTTTEGTESKGLYRFDGTRWAKENNTLLNNAIQGMAVDKNGGIWIAQSGRTGAQAITGGVNYYADSSFVTSFYSASNGVSSRNTRSIFVDTSRNNGGNPRVWVAAMAQITAGVTANGGVCTGLNNANPFFSNVANGIDKRFDVGGAQTIGGDGNEIWAFASANFGQSQIVRYDAVSRDTLGALDFTKVPQLTNTFQAKSIYFDALGNKWLGMQTNGLVVQDNLNNWHLIDTATYRHVLPVGTIINNNAITGDKFGNVYIGTTNGLVYYNKGPVNDVKSYRRFTTVHGLPSNNVRGIAVDTGRYKLIVATDNGIIFFDQQCVGANECWNQTTAKSGATSIGDGNWSNPGIWSSNKVPDSTTIVTIVNNVTVDIDGECNRLNLVSPGSFIIQSGKKLHIAEEQAPTIQVKSGKWR
ncbi:MAG TPA: M4 family metallopeptidase [Ferruginibacter sp.]|nr:M4 family metallopeptidase [Ferruginibacter sp.]HMP22049.1 M4 family metallopeptidase [Ferruginibacter sp.]